MIRSRWLPAALVLMLAPVLPAQDSVTVPYARFLELYRATGVVHEPTWSDVRGRAVEFRGRTISYQVVVKGRIDSAQESRLIAYTRRDESVMVVVPGGGTSDLGRWYGVLGHLPDDGSASHIVATAITEVRSPIATSTTMATTAAGTDGLLGGANAAVGPGSTSAAAGPADTAALPPLPQTGPPVPHQQPVPRQQPAQANTAAPNDTNAVARLDRFIASRNARVSAAERRLMATDIVAWSRYHGMRWEFFAAIITIESNFSRTAVSRSGAMGLGQLMPFNCTTYGVSDPFDIRQNLRGSAQHLREFLDHYRQRSPQEQFQLTLACYNAGPGAVRRHGGVPPYAETQNYIRQVAVIYVQLCNGG